MLFFLVLTILYGIPIFLGILLIYGILFKLKYPKAGVIWNILLTGLGIFLIGATFYNWWSRQHLVHFHLGKSCKITLHITEVESFMDVPVEFDAEIDNLMTGKKQTFRFSSQEGPAFEFKVSEANPHLIHITGLVRNVGRNYTVNMDKGRKTSYTDTGHVYRKRLTVAYTVETVR